MWGQIIGSVVGGLLGGSGSEKKESTTIDPRLGYYVYGQNGRGGLLGDMFPIFRQQFAQGGLNDMQRGGLEMQRQTLMSPQFTQGYDAMRSMGLGLMGAGVAQNPFTSGGMGGQMGGLQQQPATNPAVVRPNTNTQYTPFSYEQTPALAALSQPIQTVAQYQAANPMPTPAEDAEAAIDDYLRRIGFDGFGEGGSSPSGVDGGLGLGNALGVLGNLGFGPIGGMLGSAIGDAIGGSGNEAGNNGGMGLGSAMGGEGVGMGSAAGNGGDNGAEGATGGDGGDDGGDGLGFAKGGKVTKKRLKGPNPKGPDDGYAALDEGEYVINSKSAKRIGYDKLARMNRR